MITWTEIVAWLVLFSITALTLAVVIAAVRDHIVMYLDKKDFWLSLSPWLILFVGIVSMISMQPPGSELDFQKLSATQQGIWYIELTVAGLICMITTCLSIKYNRSVIIGIVVSFYKVILSLVLIIGLSGQLSLIFNRKSTLLQQGKAVIIFAILAALRDEFINGKQVYKDKSWAFPPTKKISEAKLLF